MKDVKDFDDVRWDDGKPTVTDYVWGRDNQTASLIRAYKDEIERLRAALWQCVHVVQSEIEYCKDHTTAWFKLCVATREKALAALREKE